MCIQSTFAIQIVWQWPIETGHTHIMWVTNDPETQRTKHHCLELPWSHIRCLRHWIGLILVFSYRQLHIESKGRSGGIAPATLTCILNHAFFHLRLCWRQKADSSRCWKKDKIIQVMWSNYRGFQTFVKIGRVSSHQILTGWTDRVRSKTALDIMKQVNRWQSGLDVMMFKGTDIVSTTWTTLIT